MPRALQACKIDIVEADAEPADRFELGRPRQQRGVHPGAVAHDQCARAGKRGGRIGPALDQAGVVKQIIAGEDALDGILVHELADHDRGHRRIMH